MISARGAADASTEPRIDVRGERVSRRDPAGACRFNGAPDRCPGRGDVAPAPATAPRCFNGAPDRCPGRAGCTGGSGTMLTGFNGAPDRCPGRGRRRPRVHLVCFNGAPDRCPGRAAGPAGRLGAVANVLQRSPGSMSGESRSRRGLDDAAGLDAASTEPRIDVRGEVLDVAHARALGVRFNGAPDRCPGESARVARYAGGPSMRFNGAPDRCPGRGRLRLRASDRARLRFNGAPDRCPGRASARTLAARRRASTEPRIDVRGESCVAGRWRRSSRFNGAPDRCPGRASRTGRARRKLGASARFNGAPDRCPGRARSGACRTRRPPALQRSPGSMSGESVAGDLAGASPSLQRSPGSMSGESDEKSRGAQPLAAGLQRSPGSMSGERPGP